MHKVKCFYCGVTFDRDKEDNILVSSRRYAHTLCHTTYELSKTQEQKDEEQLKDYIKKKFNTTTISSKITKQIEKFVKEEGYTYSGIYRTLVYFYDIKGNSIEKANGGIGIVSWVYDEAKQYYFSIWQANQKQDYVINHSQIEDLIPKEEVVVITTPQRKPKKRKLFTFLDDIFEGGI